MPPSSFVFDTEAWTTVASHLSSIASDMDRINPSVHHEEKVRGRQSPVGEGDSFSDQNRPPDATNAGADSDSPRPALTRVKSSPSLSVLKRSALRSSLKRRKGTPPRRTPAGNRTDRPRSFTAPGEDDAGGNGTNNDGNNNKNSSGYRNRRREISGMVRGARQSSFHRPSDEAPDLVLRCEVHPQVRLRSNRCPRCAAGELKKMRARSFTFGSDACAAQQNDKEPDVEEVALDEKWAEALRRIQSQSMAASGDEDGDIVDVEDAAEADNSMAAALESNEERDVPAPTPSKPPRKTLSTLDELHEAIERATKSIGKFSADSYDDEEDNESISQSSIARDALLPPAKIFAETKVQPKGEHLSPGLGRLGAKPVEGADVAAVNSSCRSSGSESSVTLSMTSDYTRESFNSLAAPRAAEFTESPCGIADLKAVYPGYDDGDGPLRGEEEDEDNFENSFFMATPKVYSEMKVPTTHSYDGSGGKGGSTATANDVARRGSRSREESTNATDDDENVGRTGAYAPPTKAEPKSDAIPGEDTTCAHNNKEEAQAEPSTSFFSALISNSRSRSRSRPRNRRESSKSCGCKAAVADTPTTEKGAQTQKSRTRSKSRGRKAAQADKLAEKKENQEVKSRTRSKSRGRKAARADKPAKKKEHQDEEHHEATPSKTSTSQQKKPQQGTSFFSAIVNHSRSRSRSRSRRAQGQSKSRSRNSAKVDKLVEQKEVQQVKQHECSPEPPKESAQEAKDRKTSQQEAKPQEVKPLGSKPQEAKLQESKPLEVAPLGERHADQQTANIPKKTPQSSTPQNQPCTSHSSLQERGTITHPHYKLGYTARKEDMIVFHKFQGRKSRRGRRDQRSDSQGNSSCDESDGEDDVQQRKLSEKAQIHSAIGQLRHLDAAFVRRSDGNWTYALVADGDDSQIRFVVNANGSTKSFPKSLWKKCVRRIKVLTPRQGDRFPLNRKPMKKKRSFGLRGSQGKGRGRLVSPSPTRRNMGVLNLPPTIREDRVYNNRSKSQ
ncbi:hypothetical protein ACHAWF_012405 [Thalassiosira exigua]